MAPKRPASAVQKKSHRGWIVLAVIFGILVIGGVLGRVATPVFVIAVILTAGLGLFTVIKGATPQLGMRSRKAGFAALGTAALLVLGGGVANATPADNAQPPSASLRIPSTPKAFASAEKSTPTPTPTPTPTTFEQVDVDSVIPFERTTINDSTVAEGTTAVSTVGVDGTKRTTYKVTYVNGQEVSREVVSEAIVVEPVSEVTTRGTLKPQPAPKPKPVTKPVPLAQPGGGNCDPNYSGACVPIASDVDCAGGSGDGPAYLDGTARVVGTDIYRLDRDKNGVACD